MIILFFLTVFVVADTATIVGIAVILCMCKGYMKGPASKLVCMKELDM